VDLGKEGQEGEDEVLLKAFRDLDGFASGTGAAPQDSDGEDERTPPDYDSPPRASDHAEFHSGEEHETSSPTDRAIFPLTIEQGESHTDVPLHSVGWKDESHPMWVRIRTVMDSGAADSVAPPTLAPQVEITESPGSRRGQCYVSASAGRMPNMGQKVLNIQTNEGKDTTVLYQIAEVSRPLTSVSATCDRGNWVVYTPEGGFIHNCQTQERTYFERKGGIYELDLWIRDEGNQGGSQSSSFPRQGY
jgi:hypothetical protein